MVVDLVQYMRNRTISDGIAKLLDAKDGKVKLYSVVASLYNDAAKYATQSAFTSTIPRAVNSNEFFSKNYAPAEEKFIALWTKLRDEHIGGFLNLQKEKKGDCTLNFSEFSLLFEGNLDFLNLGYSKGWSASAIGNNLYIGLKKISVPLEKITYSEEKNAICYITLKHMSSDNAYHQIILD
jgi:hypothetical protein